MADEPHRPVLLDEVSDILQPSTNGIYLDCTVGAGGHAQRILALSQPGGRLIGLDRDPVALAIAGRTLEHFGDRVILEHANFTDAGRILAEQHVDAVNGILFDLGLSSIQLDSPDRGFSFRYPDAPLDMRADPSRGPTAAQLIAHVPERELADILWQLADERRSRRIARAVCAERRRTPIKTVGQLLAVIARAMGPHRRQRIHPATRSMQAIRMWTNAELPNLKAALLAAKDLLVPGGSLCTISFHSAEDRVAKNVLRDQAREGVWDVLTRRPMRPTEAEVRSNPRARSAKLRAARRKDVM